MLFQDINTLLTKSGIWNGIRSKEEKVPRSKLLWFPFHIPKYSIVAWMAILNRLPTKDRLLATGMQIDGSSNLCHAKMETRDH